MTDLNKPSLRIDWFDGTVTENTGQNSASHFADEEVPDTLPKPDKREIEKKPIGFKRLYDLSLLKPPGLNFEIAERPGFWLLLDTELKGDFIVLILKILANVYKSLQPGSKGKIATLLKTKFENSQFINILNDYVSGLPKVRIVEKKMNLQLWNDVETFFFDVLDLCEGIYKFGVNSSQYMQDLHQLLETAESSAIGVENEHSEKINNIFYNRLRQLKSDIYDLIRTLKNTSDETKIQKRLDPNSFRNLHIFPRKQDLITETVDIKPNIVNGAYPSAEDYLDLQFKLLREDYIAPLREGVSCYMKNTNKTKHENICVYPKVRVIRSHVSNNKVGYLVDIAWSERLGNLSVNKTCYAHSKRLMFGSLLLFVANNFETIYFASVLDSSYRLLTEGYVAVSFSSAVPSDIFSTPYLMVESEVFFEPYHRVLKVLQDLRADDLPMREYIVDVQSKRAPPAYLSSETIYGTVDSKTSDEIYFPVLDTEQWPPAESFGLDLSQMEAYTLALTREFAVIQGPPGTGKTFIGTKIASTLLKNLSLEGTPMLVICYTNHALDQFLEGILNVTTNVVRLGSQSKNKNIEPYTLNNLRMKSESKYSRLYVKKRKELERLSKQMTEIQDEIEKCERNLLSFKSVKPYLKVGEMLFTLKSDDEDPILDWIFGHLEEKPNRSINENVVEEIDDWEKLSDSADCDNTNDKLATCFSEEEVLKEIDYLKNSMTYINDINDNEIERQKMKSKFEEKIHKLRKRLEYFKKCMIWSDPGKFSGAIKSLYDLTPKQRWQVYLNAIGEVKDGLMEKMNVLLEKHNTLSNEIDEVTTFIDSDVMTSARVVAATTSVAARRHDLLKQLQSPIVIVEEAAEILEAHIIASLTTSCKHLILIGDHKQLRPTTAHYKLAKKYNLEISLFERMIRNNIHSRTLHIQRRMRPNFVELLVPTIYEKLDCHPFVQNYPDVRGMNDNLYFHNHTVYEESMAREDSWSHRNSYEAKWCVSLANYLRRMEYAAEDIVILSTYAAQSTLIKQLSKNYALLSDVHITVVDNYQGEESKIVILSLVRSNKDGNIGFLSAENRICVALSRAKEGFSIVTNQQPLQDVTNSLPAYGEETPSTSRQYTTELNVGQVSTFATQPTKSPTFSGFYIFGNMNVLKSASQIWRSINQKLNEQTAIGDDLRLYCKDHKNTINVKSVEELDDSIAEPCFKMCK